MTAAPVWRDEWRGATWTYGLTYRPLAAAHVPVGWLIELPRPAAEGFAHGVVSYPRQLTDAEVAAHELTFVRHTAG